MTTMSYKAALAEAKRVGASHAKGAAHLAQTAEVLCKLHRGANPQLVYEGALKKGLQPLELAALARRDPVAFGDLMFV